MVKVVIHCGLGFFVGEKFSNKCKDAGLDVTPYRINCQRTDPELVRLVEEENPENEAWLCVMSIPDNVEWVIEDYDGSEWVSEKHRTWPSRSGDATW